MESIKQRLINALKFALEVENDQDEESRNQTRETLDEWESIIHEAEDTEFDCIGILSLNETDANPATIHYMKTFHTTFAETEKSLNEPLLNIIAAEDEVKDDLSGLDETQWPEEKVRLVIEQIQGFARLAEKYDAAYIRFLKN